MWSAQATSFEPTVSVKPAPDAVGSQQTLVLGSQNTSSPGGSPGVEFGKLERIRITPSWRMVPNATGLFANWVEMLKVNRASAVSGHPQQACIACSVLKT
jgi:hypothetical protein